MIRKLFSAFLRSLRVKRSVTQERMAEHLRITPRAYSNLERGKSCASAAVLLSLLLLLDDEELRFLLGKIRVLWDTLDD